MDHYVEFQKTPSHRAVHGTGNAALGKWQWANQVRDEIIFAFVYLLSGEHIVE